MNEILVKLGSGHL